MHRRDAGKHRSVSLDLEARTSRLSLMGGDCGQRPLLGTDSHTVFCFVGEFSIYSYTSLMSIPCSYLCRSHNPLLGPVPIAPNAAPSFCSLPTYVLLVTFHASIYFSIQLLKHWFSFEERLEVGVWMQVAKQFSFTLEMRNLALAILACCAMAVWMRWRVSEEDEEGEEGEPKEYVDGLLWGGGDRMEEV